MFVFPPSATVGTVVSDGGVQYEKTLHGWKRKDYAGNSISIDSSIFTGALQALPDSTTAQDALEEVDRVCIKSEPTGITGATSVKNIVFISLANYEAISTPDPNILYVIRG